MKFSTTTAEALQHYVYLLRDPINNEIFYVGKGNNDRCFMHNREEYRETEKLKRIAAIKDAGYETEYVIHRHGMTEDQALEVEAALIDILPNLTNAVKGKGAIRGPASIASLEEMYNCEVADFDGLKVMMIKINKSYGKLSNWDALRFSWMVDARKAMEADVVVGVAQGVIRIAVIPESWESSHPVTHKELWAFHGISPHSLVGRKQLSRKVLNGNPVDKELEKRLVNKAIPEQFSMKGSQQSIRYNYK